METHANPTKPPNTKMEGCPIADPELGLSPLTGSPPLTGPVELADARPPELDLDDAGEEVILTPDDEVALILLVMAMPVPVLGKGTMEGAEKFPNPLGSPVSLGSLPVSYVEKRIHILWYSTCVDGTTSKA